MSGELWFGEGFTSYYDSLVLRRLRVMALDRYLEEIADTLNYVVNSPARRLHSALEMSQRAPLVDGAEWRDPVNKANIFVSYYSFGAAIALGLDLTLRGRSDKLSLEDFMRAVWETHGRTETPYTNEDLERQLAAVTQDESFAREFFARFIAGREVVDYKALFVQAGLLLRLADENRAYLGEANLTYGDSNATIEQATYRGSPLYAAGLDRGDEILTIDATQILSDDDLKEFLDTHEPGQKLTVEFRKQGVAGATTITLGVDPTLELVTYERADLEPTPEMLRFRDRWLGPLTTSEARLSRHCPECRRAFPFEYEHCPFDAKKLRLALATDEDEK